MRTNGALRVQQLDAQKTAQRFIGAVVSELRFQTVMDEIIGSEVDKEAQSYKAAGFSMDTAYGLAEAVLTQRHREVNDLEAYLQGKKVYRPDQVAQSFDLSDAGATSFALSRPISLYRLSGGESPAIGRFFVCCKWDPQSFGGKSVPASGWVDGSALALPPSNLTDHLVRVEVPTGTRIVVGKIRNNFADEIGEPIRGGNTQIFVVDPLAGEAVQHFVPADNPSEPYDVVVWKDNRLVRFRAASPVK